MFSTLRTRFGIPGVISVIALVFAMLGGAYAANNSSSGGKATASAKAKKGPRGPKGPKGDPGPAGPAGPQGPTGSQGAKGDTGSVGANGKDGTNGTNGTNGTSVLASTEPTGSGNCEGRGGSKFVTGATTTYACNGKEGSGGGGGGGWSETLPAGKTETGSWYLFGNGSPAERNVTSISFTIPLTKADAEAIEVKYWKQSAQDPSCFGTPFEPEAAPGVLCIYTLSNPEYNNISTNPEVYPTDFSELGAVGTAGAFLAQSNFLPNTNYYGGSWAITAPLPG